MGGPRCIFVLGGGGGACRRQFAQPGPAVVLIDGPLDHVARRQPLQRACVYRKPKRGRSGDEVRQGWGTCDASSPLSRAEYRRILVKVSMSSDAVAIVRIGSQDSAQ